MGMHKKYLILVHLTKKALRPHLLSDDTYIGHASFTGTHTEAQITERIKLIGTESENRAKATPYSTVIDRPHPLDVSSVYKDDSYFVLSSLKKKTF